jgi:hypothetical protein
VQAPEDTVEDPVVVFQGTAAAAAVSGWRKEWSDPCPVMIRKFMATAHGRPAKGDLLSRPVVSAVV